MRAAWQRALALLLAPTSLAQHPARTTRADGSSAACPCVDPWANSGAAGCNSGQVRGSTMCLPANYGAASCEAWDEQHPDCAGDDAPGWCTTSWCYVDASNCDRPANDYDVTWATAAPAAGSGFSRAALVRSYETCGNVNTYEDDRLTSTLAGAHYRISFPGDSSSGYTILTQADGTKTGSVVRFMEDIRDATGFTWEIHEVSDTSRGRYSSSFTACVHEVAIGETDLCIG